VAGRIDVPRRYFACGCGQSAAPMDTWAGIGSRTISDEARRLIVLAGSTWSFDQASAKLKELCRLSVSNDTVRAVCDEEGHRVDQWVRKDQASVEKLSAAEGELEFSSDGTSVNTTEGWREIRLSVLDKRQSGPPATPRQWDDRVLPAPTARLAWSQIADSRRVGARWAAMFAHAGIDADAPLSVIADGAKWIWEQAGLRLPGANAQWVVDVYHVSEHLHACGKALLGEGKPARQWANQRLMELLERGGPGFIEELKRLADQPIYQQKPEALDRLLCYLRDNRDRMWYRQRLEAGRVIGSGLIEGGCKSVLGARLKINSARWRVQRAERMGHLRCLQYSNLWETYWDYRLN
jgi:hypothetical protein